MEAIAGSLAATSGPSSVGTQRTPSIHRLEHKQRATAYAFTPNSTSGSQGASARHRGRRLRNRTPSRSRHWRTVAIAWSWLGRRGCSTGHAHLEFRRGIKRRYQGPPGVRGFAEGSALYAARQYRDAAIASSVPCRAMRPTGRPGRCSKDLRSIVPAHVAGGKAASDRATEAATQAARWLPVGRDHIALPWRHAPGAMWRPGGRKHAGRSNSTRARGGMALLGDSYSAYVYACNRIRTRNWPSRTTARPSSSAEPSTAVSNRAHT